MNPNTAQSLDPKLKEVYDRVMGAPVSPQSSANSASEHVPVEGMPVQKAVNYQSPHAEQPPIAQSPATEPQMVSINTSAAPTAKPASSKKISPIIFVAAGVGFFLAYTFVWLKVFKVF